MKRWVRGIIVGLGIAFALLAALALLLQRWAQSAEFRQRVEREAGAAVGVPVALGALHVDLWPVPAVAADEIVIQTKPPVRVQRLEVRPAWPALLRGQFQLKTLVVRSALLPQGPVTVDAHVTLGDDGLPDRFTFRVLEGRLAGAKGEVTRAVDHWPVLVHLGGGEIRGSFRMARGKGGARLLSGEVVSRDVEVAALTAPSRALTGKLQATTALRAEFGEMGELADAMRTRTQFTVRGAVLHGLDLARAVRTIGISRGGETRLDSLAGVLVTQGKAVQLNNLAASSGALAANGNAAVSPTKNLSGQVTVQLAGLPGAAVGVPLALGGTLDSPSVTLSRGAVFADRIGTTVRDLFGRK